jgi:DNA-binding MarR family transcriptional regulator
VYQPLDPLLQNQLRLALMSLLSVETPLPFSGLKEKTAATAGNLSIQIAKLKAAGYIDVNKQFLNNYPQTLVCITEKGKTAFRNYATSMQGYLHPGVQNPE